MIARRSHFKRYPSFSYQSENNTLEEFSQKTKLTIIISKFGISFTKISKRKYFDQTFAFPY